MTRESIAIPAFRETRSTKMNSWISKALACLILVAATVGFAGPAAAAVRHQKLDAVLAAI